MTCGIAATVLCRRLIALKRFLVRRFNLLLLKISVLSCLITAITIRGLIVNKQSGLQGSWKKPKQKKQQGFLYFFMSRFITPPLSTLWGEPADSVLFRQTRL